MADNDDPNVASKPMESAGHHQTITPIIPLTGQNDIARSKAEVAIFLQLNDPVGSYSACIVHQLFSRDTSFNGNVLGGADLLVGKDRDHV